MASIVLKNVSLDFPIYNTSSRSIKKKFLKTATGGILNKNSEGDLFVRALSQINMNIQEGDRVGLIGHNGSGKSTLLRLLNKVYSPSEGNVNISGKISSLIDITTGIDPELTGIENIMLRGRMLGMTKFEVNKHLDEIISFSELGEFLNIPIRTYSTGMSMRLSFAISTTVCSDILLMDEWLSVGDLNFRQKAETRLKQLIDKTKILVIASHAPEQILKNCNRAILLDHGKILKDGSPKEVCSTYFV